MTPTESFDGEKHWSEVEQHHKSVLYSRVLRPQVWMPIDTTSLTEKRERTEGFAPSLTGVKN